MPLSKNQKRKQRIANKVKQEVMAMVVRKPAVSQSPPGAGRSRSARRRRQRRNQGKTTGNPYLFSLINPEEGIGAKVPDMVSFPSSTFQTEYCGTLTPTGSGDGVGVVFTPFIGTSDGTTSFPIYEGTNALAGGGYTWTGVNWTNRSTIISLYDLVRPVSASIDIRYVGTSTNDSGILCLGILPRGDTKATSILTQFSSTNTQSYTEMRSVRTGGKVVWKPQDNQDLEYEDSTFSASQEADLVYPPTIFVAASGMQTSGSVYYRVICNWEAIPTTGTLNLVNATSSPSNSNWLEGAFRWAGQIGSHVMPVADKLIGASSQLAANYVTNRLLGNPNRNNAAGMRSIRYDL